VSADWTTRPATAGDAEAILAVGIARDVADTGEPDWQLEAARDALAAAQDTVVVADAGRAVVAFAMLTGVDARVTVHPDACGRGIGAWLRDWVEERARERGVTQLRQEVMTANDEARALLEESGYSLADSFWRMARRLDGREPPPRRPSGVTAREFVRGRDDRAAYELVSQAMAEVPGSTERTFEEWTARALGEVLAPDLSVVAEAGGAMAGLALCERWGEGDGYVDYLAVATPWRGRGLGRALLAEALAGFARSGMRRGLLWVHGSNESATRLYRSAGMEASFRADRYVKPLGG
jgi:mycothiol synthase